MEHKILLVDGNALVHRAFHALPPLTAKNGVLVNAVYGFFALLLSAVKELNPEYIITAFDEKGPTFRDQLYPEYKAKRVKAPQALYDQIPLIKKLLAVFEVPIYAVLGFEADDIVGTLCQRVKSEKLKVKSIILTGDKDTYQLIDDDTTIFTAKKGLKDTAQIDKKTFVALYGFEPKYMVDFKALRGDPSDNIPGVEGIGEVTAKKLITRFHTLENVYANLDKVPPALAQKLENHQKEARLSQKLSKIDCQVPLKLNLEKAKLNDYDFEAAQKIFLELGFKSLISRLPRSNRKTANHIQPSLL